MTGKPSPIFRCPGLSIERQRNKDGPSPTWIIWQPHSARIVMGDNFTQILKIVRWPVKTPTGEALQDWLVSGLNGPEKHPQNHRKKPKPLSEMEKLLDEIEQHAAATTRCLMQQWRLTKR